MVYIVCMGRALCRRSAVECSIACMRACATLGWVLGGLGWVGLGRGCLGEGRGGVSVAPGRLAGRSGGRGYGGLFGSLRRGRLEGEFVLVYCGHIWICGSVDRLCCGDLRGGSVQAWVHGPVIDDLHSHFSHALCLLQRQCSWSATTSYPQSLLV